VTTNPEQRVLDAIDTLVNEQMRRRPTDDYNQAWSQRCPDCRCEWHGLKCQGCGCPGRYATSTDRGDDTLTLSYDEAVTLRLRELAALRATCFDNRQFLTAYHHWRHIRCTQCQRHLPGATITEDEPILCDECTDMLLNAETRAAHR
jgi:hypothetical protein